MRPASDAPARGDITVTNGRRDETIPQGPRSDNAATAKWFSDLVQIAN